MRSRRGKHINNKERYKIEALYDVKTSISEIARQLDRPRETIQREIKKGLTYQVDTYGKGYYRYLADAAQRVTDQRQQKKGAGLKIANNHELASYIEHMILEEKFAPDPIIGRLEKEHQSKPFSTKTLYNYIHAGVLGVTMKDLPMRGKRKKKESEVYRQPHNHIKGTSIEDRPKEVYTRKEFGHWEGDYVVGKKGTDTHVITLIERKTRKTITKRVLSRNKENMVALLDELEKQYGANFSAIFKTITLDNGPENLDFDGMQYSKTRKSQRTEVYYAHPYRSSERGSNENVNGILRRWIPKKTDISKVTEAQLREYTDWINQYPRKILDYETAEEAFQRELHKLKIAS